jgi:hypothetical protein
MWKPKARHMRTSEAGESYVEHLALLIDQRDDAGVLAWFARHFPRCLAMIPRRRQFLRGIHQDAQDRFLRKGV